MCIRDRNARSTDQTSDVVSRPRFAAWLGAQARMRHHAIALLEGRVLVFAGCTPPSCERPAPAQLFDPRSKRLTDSAAAGPALVDAIARHGPHGTARAVPGPQGDGP